MKQLCLWISIWSLLALSSPNIAASLLPPLDSHYQPEQLQRPQHLPSDQALVDAGTKIGAITIQAGDIFDTHQRHENALLFRFANHLHIQTRKQTIAQQLLFQSGDNYHPQRIAESERRLRALGYLDNVSIVPTAASRGKVDLTVTSRDLWSLNPGLSFSRSGGDNSIGLAIEELNLLGRGHYIRIGFDKDVDRDSSSLALGLSHLRQSQWQLDLDIANNSDGKIRSLALKRPYQSLDGRFTAGLNMARKSSTKNLYSLGVSNDKFQQEKTTLNGYLGWSNGLNNHWTRRQLVGVSLQDSNFSALAATQVLPNNRKLVYPWFQLTWIENQWVTRKNQLVIGKTEDINPGWQVNLKVGQSLKSLDADSDATLLSANVTHGDLIGHNWEWQAYGYSRARIESGDTVNNTNGAWLRIFKHWSPKHKSYAFSRFDSAHKLDLDQQLLLGGHNGLRGYPSNYQSGTSRWLTTIEQRYYSDWYPFRLFNVGAAVFFDFGKTNNPKDAQSSLGLLRDVGAGLRLGNSRSGIGKVVHFDIAVPLDRESDIGSWQFLVQTKSRF